MQGALRNSYGGFRHASEGLSVVGREDALEGAVVDSTAQGHMWWPAQIPPSARTLQPYMMILLLAARCPHCDRIAALAGSAGSAAASALFRRKPISFLISSAFDHCALPRLPTPRSPSYIPPEQAGHHGFHPLALLHRILGELQGPTLCTCSLQW